jgi:hypothetical protein
MWVAIGSEACKAARRQLNYAEYAGLITLLEGAKSQHTAASNILCCFSGCVKRVTCHILHVVRQWKSIWQLRHLRSVYTLGA